MMALSSAFPCLETLVLSGGGVMVSTTSFCSDEDLITLAQGCRTLSRLEFDTGRFALSPAGILAAVQAMPLLQYLKFPKTGSQFSGCAFTSVDVTAVLRAMPSAQGGVWSVAWFMCDTCWQIGSMW